MKRIIFTILILIPLISFGTVTVNNKEGSSLYKGLPMPDEGIKVIPMKKNFLSNKKHNELLARQKQIKEKGYFETPNTDARIIYNMRNIKPLKEGSNNPEDTHLKSTIKDVGLAFEFQGLPIDQKNVIGYAATGMYQKGWTGVTEIFVDSSFGTCQYTLSNIKLSHGSEFVPEEVARYDVNGKVTTLDVRGNINSGYAYSLHWADNNYMNDLDCANMSFNQNITDNMIALAKRIDKQMQTNKS